MSAAPKLAAEPTADLEAFLIASVRDPSSVVWAEDVFQSASAKATILALQGRLQDALWPLTTLGGGPDAARALRDAEGALLLLQDVVRRMAWSHAAFVLAFLKDRGVTLRLEDGRVKASPGSLVNEQVARMIRDWRAPLRKMLESQNAVG